MKKQFSFFYYISSIAPFIKPYIKWIFIAFIFTVIFAVSNVLIMPLVNDIVREVTNRNMTYFNNHILNACLLFFIRISSKYIPEYTMDMVASKVMMDIRIEAFKMLHYFPSDEYNSQKHGDLISRIMHDSEKINYSLYQNFQGLLPNALTIIGVCGYLFYINFELTALSLFGAPIFIASLSYFTKRLRRVTNQIQQKTADITQMVQETLANIKIIQIYNYSDTTINKFKRLHQRYINGHLKEKRFQITREQIDAYVQFFLFIFILWYGGYHVLNNRISPSDLLVFFTGIALLIDPIYRLSKVYSLTYQVTASIERILFILKMPIPDACPNPISLSSFNTISFSKVTFNYPKSSKPALKNISFTINAGDLVGIVGQSGSGKSTMVNLLTKFYVPSSGNIQFDHHDLNDISVHSIRNHIAYVPQESLLFRANILENCRIGKPTASVDEVIEALKIANAWDFVQELPDQLLTKIGTQGLKLSGGQRQRLSIARAIVSEPSLLILDEATSALDSHSETIIQESINQLRGRFTIIVIAHRLSTIQNSDTIFVLKDGLLSEEGTHASLTKENGEYAHLLQHQNLAV